MPWSISMSAASSRPGSSSSARCAEKIAASFSSPPSLACCRLLYVVAHPLQGLVQGEVLFLGTMPAVVRRQADGAEPRQGTAGQAGRSADAGQGTGDSRRSRRLARGDGARSLLRSPAVALARAASRGAEGRLAVFAATDHLYLVLFGDPQAHDADQAVDAGHLPGEVQFGLAGKALRGLA